jgi:hypothetical protein
MTNTEIEHLYARAAASTGERFLGLHMWKASTEPNRLTPCFDLGDAIRVDLEFCDPPSRMRSVNRYKEIFFWPTDAAKLAGVLQGIAFGARVGRVLQIEEINSAMDPFLAGRRR